MTYVTTSCRACRSTFLRLFSLAAASVGGISLLTLPLVLALTLGDRVTRTDAD
jgi:hypothetical protein